MDSKTILVTGGAGFIGSNLVELLVSEGYFVKILDNFSSGFIDNIKDFGDSVELFEGDIRDRELVFSLVSKCDVVCHLAAMISVSESIKHPLDCYDVNVIGSINVMDACVEYGVRFIFMSSAAVYGLDETEVKVESICCNPISPYGLSKLDVEKMCSIYANNRGLSYVCFRNFNVYGPKQDVNSAYAAVIPKFITNALNGENIIIYGDGFQTRDFIYVGDICYAILNSIESDYVGVFNLGSGVKISVNDLSLMIKDIVNCDSSIVYKSERVGDIKHSRSSYNLFNLVSGWKPVVNFKDGIRNTVKYYENKFSVKR